MKMFPEEYNILKAAMEKAEQDRLWDHFVQTGQVLPTTQETMQRAAEIERQINEVVKMQYTYPFPCG